MKQIFNLLAPVLFAAISSSVFASNTTILKADRYLDVDTGKLISPAVLVIEDEKIIAINPKILPNDAKTIILDNATLLPGLIDMHTHITQDMDGDWRHEIVTKSAADMALKAVNNAKKTLAAGFTTIRDLGAYGFSDIALMKAIEDGYVDGPDIFASGHAIGITGGHCDVTGLTTGVAETGPKQGIADGSDEILKAIRYQVKQGAKVIKICASAGVLSAGNSVGGQQYSDEEFSILVKEVHRRGVKVAAHAHGAQGILAAVNAGVDSIEHGTFMTKKIAKAMKKNNTFLVPTVYLIVNFDLNSVPPSIRPKAELVGQKAFSGLDLAIQEGVAIAYGTDSGVYSHGDNAKQFAVFVNHGMSELEAIRSATINAAELLGVADRGRIAIGLKADVIAVAGNPLQDIKVMESATFVMKSGKVYKTAD